MRRKEIKKQKIRWRGKGGRNYKKGKRGDRKKDRKVWRKGKGGRQDIIKGEIEIQWVGKKKKRDGRRGEGGKSGNGQKWDFLQDVNYHE